MQHTCAKPYLSGSNTDALMALNGDDISIWWNEFIVDSQKWRESGGLPGHGTWNSSKMW